MSPSPLRHVVADRANSLLLGGAAAIVASLLLPWWSLHSSVVNGQQVLFDFQIGPLGMGINTIVGDPRTLLAELQVVYWAVTIALLPISASLGLAAFNGVYCVLRGRRGMRVLIAPLWSVIALFWWAFYFLMIYGFFEALGLIIPPTGSADLTWQGYQLAGATWGWDVGLWLGIAGTAVLFAGAALASKGAKASAPAPEASRLAFGVHGIGLLLLALVNLGAMAVLLASLKENGIAWLILAPVLLLFAMAFFARRPKPAAARKARVPALPKIPKASFALPKVTLPRRIGGEGLAAAKEDATEAPSDFACPRCGQRFPTQVQLDAHKLTHTLSAQAAEGRQKMDELGRKLFGRP